MRRTISLLALFLLPFAVSAESGLEVDEYEDVSVLVGGLNQATHEVGLTEDRLRKRIEPRLRTAGLVPRADQRSQYLLLGLQASFVKLQDGSKLGAFYRLRLQFIQPVWYMAHGKTLYRSAATWQRSRFGIVAGPNEAKRILESLDGLVDKFLSEYLKANRK